MRNIARFTGANVTGITINQYQVNRGNELHLQNGLKNQCKSIQGDFMRLPFPDNHFDGVYAIEATCHAPDRTKVFSEILRVLKPGQVFACYEWCLTDKYDKDNAEHRLIKKQIEEGDGLPDTAYTWEMDEALRKVGFGEVVGNGDVYTMGFVVLIEGVGWGRGMMIGREHMVLQQLVWCGQQIN